jgi:putative solute:sodium symporter small subunit
MKNDSLSETHRRAYWRKNLIIVTALLTVWFVVSFGLSIVFVDALNEIRMGGFRLGFWMAQQGSLYIFVILIFVYVWLMNRLDRQYGVEEQEEAKSNGAAQ